jgi:CubicO group peptidase (beta-lactamase class C family)
MARDWCARRARANLVGAVHAEPRIDRLFTSWDRDDSPGCAVAVLREGEPFYVRGYGMADLEHRVKITPSTVFHVASLSKQFTAFAVLLLAFDGKLHLDDDIRDYLDEVPALGHRITLAQCLHHTSGLRDHSPLLKLSGWRPMDERSESDICFLVRRQQRLNFRPGTDFNYCNTGYVLLASVVQRASGVRFRDFVAGRIFRPLGMHDSRVRDDHTEIVENRAQGYAPAERGGWSLWMPEFDYAGATSVNTTAEDLMRWAGYLIEARRRGDAVVQALTTAGGLTKGPSVRYGGGLEIGSYRRLPVVKHSGWDLGYQAHLAVYPTARFAVAVLFNVSTLSLATSVRTPETLARRIADRYLGHRLSRPLRPAIHLSQPRLTKKTGLYRHPETSRAMWIHLVDGTLRLASDRTPSSASGMALQPVGGTRFRGSDETTEVILDGTALKIREEAGVVQRSTRAEVWKPSRRVLVKCAGTYRSDEIDATVTFTVVGDDLVMKRRKFPPRVVSAAYRYAFTDDIATYHFVRDGGRVTHVDLSLDRAFHVRFDRVATPARAPGRRRDRARPDGDRAPRT